MLKNGERAPDFALPDQEGANGGSPICSTASR